MAKKVLALNDKGSLTYCTVDPDKRGKGRCNHLAHQESWETVEQFVERVKQDSNYKDYSRPVIQGEVEFKPYRMTEEEKASLVKVEGRKQLEDPENQGGYIELETPLWNDMDKDAFSKVSGVKVSDLNAVLRKEKAVVLESYPGSKYKEGQVLTASKAEEAASEGVELGTGVVGLNKYAEKFGFQATKDVYVVPYYMREDPPDGEGKNELNVLYNYLIYNRKDPDKQQQAYESLLNNAESRAPLTQKGGYPIPSLIDRLKGKSGVMRAYMSGREVCYSGRAVLSSDVSMEYGYIKIPPAMACDIYKPSITDRLRQQGKTYSEIKEFFDRYKGDQASIPKEHREELDEVVRSLGMRCIANRQPSLHEASLLSFKPLISEDATVKVNPLNFQGYNADLDGDTFTIYAINDVNISNKAESFSAESKSGTKMPRHQETSIIKPSKEALWGLLNILSRRSS